MSRYTVREYAGRIFLEEDGVPILHTRFRDADQVVRLGKIAHILTDYEENADPKLRTVCEKGVAHHG